MAIWVAAAFTSDGEIYAATIWRLWELFLADDISQDTLFDYLIGGMNFTPAGPAMEDMRDGILEAVSVLAAQGDVNAHECLVWEAFADFGIGEGASGRIQGGGPFGGGRVRITESFDLPAVCSGPVAPVASDDSYSVAKDTDLTVSAPGVLDNDSDANGDAITAILLSNPSNGVLVGGLNPGGSFTYRPDPGYEGFDSFTYDASDGGMSDTATVNITVTGGGGGGGTMHIGDLDGGSVISGRGNKWIANVTITVHDAGETLVDGATVSGTWSNGAKGGGSCTTGESGPGKCTVSKNGLKTNVGTATFTVTDVTHASLSYSVANVNHDPDIPVDSTGTAITITLP